MARKKRGRNEGSIYKRQNGTWRAQIYIDGDRLNFGAKTKSECLKWLREIQSQIDLGLNFKSGKVSLSDYLASWMSTHEITLRDHTINRYKQLIRNYIDPDIGEIQLFKLHLSRVEQYYVELIERNVGVRTIREIHAILRKALNKAVTYGYIVRNPVQGAALPKYRHKEMQVLNESQVGQFLITAHSSPKRSLYHLAVITGMRQGELFGLQWDDLNWIRGEIQVKRQVQRVPRQPWKFVEPKTKAGRRSILLGDASLGALRWQKENLEVLRKAAGKKWQEFNLVFPSAVGTPFNPSNLRIDFNRVLDQAGLPRIRFHDLRHTAASIMLNHGVPVIVVSKILGHEKPSTTMNIYGHLINEMQQEAVRVMDDLLTPIQVKIEELESVKKQK